MADFLTPEWLAELDAAARASDGLTAVAEQGPLVVEQRVIGAPAGDACYHLVVDEDGARVIEGPAAVRSLALVTDYATAVAINRGESTAQAAIAAGRLELRGGLDALVRHRDTLVAVDDVFTAVRARTSYPDTPSEGVPDSPGAGHR